jgi:hypothetical protein
MFTPFRSTTNIMPARAVTRRLNCGRFRNQRSGELFRGFGNKPQPHPRGFPFLKILKNARAAGEDFANLPLSVQTFIRSMVRV